MTVMLRCIEPRKIHSPVIVLASRVEYIQAIAYSLMVTGECMGLIYILDDNRGVDCE